MKPRGQRVLRRVAARLIFGQSGKSLVAAASTTSPIKVPCSLHSQNSDTEQHSRSGNGKGTSLFVGDLSGKMVCFVMTAGWGLDDLLDAVAVRVAVPKRCFYLVCTGTMVSGRNFS